VSFAVVSESSLSSWLAAGLDDDDPDLAVAKSELAELQDRLARGEKQQPIAERDGT
jgi:hypothetical protein